MKRSSAGSSSGGPEWMTSQLGRRETYKKHAGSAISLSLPPRTGSHGWVEKHNTMRKKLTRSGGATEGSHPLVEEAKDAEDELQHIHFEYTMAPTFETQRHMMMIHGRPVVVLSRHYMFESSISV